MRVDWSGSYGGMFAGHQSGHFKVDGCTGICPHDPRLSGNLFGVVVGHDWQQPDGLVTGAFAWLNLAGPKSPLVSTGSSYTYNDEFKKRFSAVIGGRVGLARGNWLPYAFAGVDYTKLRITTSPGTSFATNYDKNYVGVAAGLGVEHMLTQNVSVDLRYMYTHLPARTFDFGGGPEKYSEPSASTVTVGLNYRF